MKKYLYVSITVLVLAGVLSFGTTALAAKGIIKGGGMGGGSTGSIIVSDLGITDVGTLPSSRWYFFKEWGHGLERFFTFNSVKKAELELRVTNEKAAEALTIQETRPDDADALATALKNYTRAAERLQARLTKLKETFESPNLEKLLEKLNEQTLKHAVLFNQLAERWDTDPYAEDANVVNPQGAGGDRIRGALGFLQKKIQEIALSAAEKDKNIEQKAKEQIQRADVAIHELESELAKLKSGFIYSSQTQSAKFAINEPGVPNNKRAINTKGTGAVARTASEPDVPNEKAGPIRLDPTPARISTNMTIERQTPKRDFGDRMKAGLDTAGGMLANAKKAFGDGKFGEAFGQARAAEVIARNGLRILAGVAIKEEEIPAAKKKDFDFTKPTREGAMPIVPGTGTAGVITVPSPSSDGSVRSSGY